MADRVPSRRVLVGRAARGHRSPVRVRGHDGRAGRQDRGCRGGAVTVPLAEFARLRRRFTGWQFEQGPGWLAAHREGPENTRHAIAADARTLAFLLERIEAEATPF